MILQDFTTTDESQFGIIGVWKGLDNPSFEVAAQTIRFDGYN